MGGAQFCVLGISLSANGASVLCSCMADGMVLLDKSEGQVLATYYGHKHQSLKIESGFASSNRHVFSGSEDGTFISLIPLNFTFRIHAILGFNGCDFN